MEKIGFDPSAKSTEEKMKVLRTYREGQYEKLKDAVYKRRGWNSNGVPTIEFLKKIGMDFPEVFEVVKDYQLITVNLFPKNVFFLEKLILI